MAERGDLENSQAALTGTVYWIRLASTRQPRCRFSVRRSIRKATNPPRSTGLPLPPFVDVRAAQEKPSRETDLYAWLLHQAKELRARQPNFIDWSELAEELDEIVALARKETVSRLRTALVHLLKSQRPGETIG